MVHQPRNSIENECADVMADVVDGFGLRALSARSKDKSCNFLTQSSTSSSENSWEHSEFDNYKRLLYVRLQNYNHGGSQFASPSDTGEYAGD